MFLLQALVPLLLLFQLLRILLIYPVDLLRLLVRYVLQFSLEERLQVVHLVLKLLYLRVLLLNGLPDNEGQLVHIQVHFAPIKVLGFLALLKDFLVLG